MFSTLLAPNNLFKVIIRGQLHKTKKFVITKKMFAITNVSNFVFSISAVC